MKSRLMIPKGMYEEMKKRGIDLSKAYPSPNDNGNVWMDVEDDEKVKILHALADLGVANVTVHL